MDLSKNRGTRGTPKWMVKIMDNPFSRMDDLGVPLFFENTHIQTLVPVGRSFIMFSMFFVVRTLFPMASSGHPQCIRLVAPHQRGGEQPNLAPVDAGDTPS